MPLPPNRHRLLLVAILLVAGWFCLEPAEAGVVVIRNRTAAKVDFVIAQTEAEARRYTLQPNQLVPIPAEDRILIAFDAGAAPRRYSLRANSIHYFLTRENKLDLNRFPLPSVTPRQEPPKPSETKETLEPLHTIPVMLLVDDNEPALRRIWEKRLRERMTAASAIFERHCRVRFEVVAVGTWTSDDRLFDFGKSLREFELIVKPAPARVAIGFTSQYRIPRGLTHLGGTRGPLHSHILIREWAQHISPAERLEVLVHELGHFLGAVHSIEDDSVMRPKIGDHRSNARAFQIGFDPLNTLVMYLVGEQLRSGRFYGFGRLQPERKAPVRSAYAQLSKFMPGDESVKNFTLLLDRPYTVHNHSIRQSGSLIAATQKVLRAVTESAQRNHQPTGPEDAAETPRQLSGDRLTEYYVRQAAAAADELPSDLAARAFLLGLGIAIDHSSLLRYNPVTASFYRQVESNQQRRERLRVLGEPTMRGRRDLTPHFAMSCALTVLLGPQAAEAAGVAKELTDARRPSGFSFVDLSADVAGVVFAIHVRDEKIPLASLAHSFAVDDYLPDINGLPEGISWDDFFENFTSAQDDRFHRQKTVLRQRVLALPGYRRL